VQALNQIKRDEWVRYFKLNNKIESFEILVRISRAVNQLIQLDNKLERERERIVMKLRKVREL
jgi:hypothetical protein